MKNFGEFIYLKPQDLVRLRAEMPVAYMGTGILEWHGLHGPLGLDGIKADGVARFLAERLGGVVFPPQHWGDYRNRFADIEFDETFRPPFSLPENHFDHTPHISKLMGIDKETYLKDRDRSEAYGGWDLFERLMVRSMFQMETYGFKAIILIPGHHPSTEPMQNAVARYLSEGGESKVICITELDYPADGLEGDHSAAFETSMMLALFPEEIDLDALGDDLTKPNIGVIGHDPRTRASKETGEKILDQILSAAKDFLVENRFID